MLKIKFITNISRRKDVTQAMAVACRHADAEALLDVFERGGLDVQALDSRLHALVRGCGPVLPPSGMAAVLELAWDRAMLVLLQEGTVIYKWTMAEAAVGQLAEALTKNLRVEDDAVEYLLAEVGLTPKAGQAWGDAASLGAVGAVIRQHLDAIAGAVQSPFAYGTQQYPSSVLDHLILVGQGAAVPGVGEYLQSRLGMNVQTVIPPAVVECPETFGRRAGDPSMIVPIGLAQFPG